MAFGSTVGKACLTFVITNIDDAFVLVTFFAESSSSRSLTPLKITIGQYIGFTIIMAISLIGFAAAVALPSEPIGFLGLLPILLGVWKFLGLFFDSTGGTEAEQSESNRIASTKSILKVSAITVMNGGDNIGTYIPLFAQVKKVEIAIFAVVYYILLGIWCLVAFLVIKQKHVLRVAEKYASYIIPFLYVGLGIYIVVKSDCYPWSVAEINDQFLGNPGQLALGIITAFLLLFIMGLMIWLKGRKRRRTSEQSADMPLSDNTPAATKSVPVEAVSGVTTSPKLEASEPTARPIDGPCEDSQTMPVESSLIKEGSVEADESQRLPTTTNDESAIAFHSVNEDVSINSIEQGQT